MKKTLLTYFIVTAISIAVFSQNSPRDIAQAKEIISRALAKVTPSQESTFHFNNVNRSLGHLSKPWETYSASPEGGFTISPELRSYFQIDSIQSGGKYVLEYKFFNDTTFVHFPYGRNKPSSASIKRLKDLPFEMLAFYPAFFLKYLVSDKCDAVITGLSKKSNTIAIKTPDNKNITLHIDAKKNELSKIVIIYPHELYGDVTKTFLFTEYKPLGALAYPSVISEMELNVEKNRTSIDISTKKIDKKKILDLIPSEYALKGDEPAKKDEIVYSKFNENIHLLELKHTDDRVLIVEFKDFLVIAEAPINTKNGELIISKAKEIVPGKPIRYFLFGHHHPHYIGGVRAFVHNGSTILTHSSNVDYINQIVSFQHSITPDVLQRERKDAVLEVFEKEKIITDGSLEMKIVHIGKLSDHTEDYLVYYFPKFKLLFEDDLVWINREGDLRPAGSRQRGLYQGVVDNNLVVEQIIQSWPVQDYGVKTIISFKELEESVRLIKP